MVVFGAFLVARHGWSGGRVFALVMLGSGLGCLFDYHIGRWLARGEGRGSRWFRRRVARLEPVLVRFARHPRTYLLINRFLPSVRPLFFVAAGVTGMPIGEALVMGLASAALWNGMLFLLGVTIGTSWPRLLHAFQTYTAVAWVVLGLAALLGGLAWWRQRRRRSKRER